MSRWFLTFHSFWINLFPNRTSLIFSSRFYSLTKMSIDLCHSFWHSKRVFIRYRLVVISEKNVVYGNYDEDYSSTKLTLVSMYSVCRSRRLSILVVFDIVSLQADPLSVLVKFFKFIYCVFISSTPTWDLFKYITDFVPKSQAKSCYVRHSANLDLYSLRCNVI